MKEGDSTSTGVSPASSFQPQPSGSDSSAAKNHVYLGDDVAPNSLRDNSRLADLGYQPELKRDFSALETFGVAFSIM